VIKAKTIWLLEFIELLGFFEFVELLEFVGSIFGQYRIDSFHEWKINPAVYRWGRIFILDNAGFSSFFGFSGLSVFFKSAKDPRRPQKGYFK